MKPRGVAVVISGLAILLAWLPNAQAIQTAGNAAGGDPVRGQRLFLQCAACHSLQPTPGSLGPPLAGIVGRKAASSPGYPYSPALREAGLEWSEQTLDQWLERPSALVPGTKMIFAGIPAPSDRAAVIAYLKGSAPAEKP